MSDDNIRRAIPVHTSERAAYIISRAAPSNQPVSANTLFARTVERVGEWNSEWGRNIFDAGLEIALKAGHILSRQNGYVRKKAGDRD